MSVYDENRRQCKRCGKMINHWEDNDCEKGLCKKVKNHQEEYEKHLSMGFFDPIEPAAQKPSDVVNIDSVRPYQVESVYGFPAEKIYESTSNCGLSGFVWDTEEPCHENTSIKTDFDILPCVSCASNPCRCKVIEMEEINRKNNQMATLQCNSVKMIKSAISEYIIHENCEKLFEQIDFAKALMITSNYVGGVIKS